MNFLKNFRKGDEGWEKVNGVFVIRVIVNRYSEVFEETPSWLSLLRCFAPRLTP
jgi:hypothetical protein